MKHQPLYREILRQAWKITWHQRLFWLLGLFSAFLVSGGAMEVLSRNLRWAFNPGWLGHRYQWYGHWQLDWVGRIWLIALCLLMLGLAFFLVYMIVKSFISLISGANECKEDKHPDLAELWHKGQNKFWPVLAVAALFRVLVMFFSLLSVLPLWLAWAGKLNLFWLLAYPVLFFLGILASLICVFLMMFSTSFIILKNKKFWLSVAEAWKLFIRHWLICLELAVVLFVVDFVAGVLAIVGVAIVALPMLLVIFFSWYIMLPPLGAVATFVGALLSLMVILLVAGVLGAFHTVTWVLAFKRMQEKTAVSRLVRWYHQLKSKIKK